MKKIVPADAILIPDSAECVYQGRIFGVYQWQQELYDGTQATFEMLKRPDTTNVICVDGEKVIIINDEQPNRASLKTFPGGRVDPEDIDILSSAQREVREEIGYRFQNWRLLQVAQPVRKIEWFTYLWLAWDVTDQQEPHHDAGEKISLEVVSFDQLKQLVTSRTGYLGEVLPLFESLESLADLQAFPEYQGQEVDR